MSGYKSLVGGYVDGSVSKEEVIKNLKGGKASGDKGETLMLEDDGDGVLGLVGEISYANMVGDISDQDYSDFYDALG